MNNIYWLKGLWSGMKVWMWFWWLSFFSVFSFYLYNFFRNRLVHYMLYGQKDVLEKSVLVVWFRKCVPVVWFWIQIETKLLFLGHKITLKQSRPAHTLEINFLCDLVTYNLFRGISSVVKEDTFWTHAFNMEKIIRTR